MEEVQIIQTAIAQSVGELPKTISQPPLTATNNGLSVIGVKLHRFRHHTTGVKYVNSVAFCLIFKIIDRDTK